MALPQLDFTQLNLAADCATTAAKRAVADGLTKVKGKLAALVDGPGGFFANGQNLANAVVADLNALTSTATRALGEIQQNVVSLRARLAAAVLTWQAEGEAAAQREFDAIKAQFPDFNQDEFLAKLQQPGFSFCQSIDEQTIADGQSTPKDIPAPVAPPSSDAEMDSLPDPTPVPVVGPGPSTPAADAGLAAREAAKLQKYGTLFSEGE